MKEIGGYIELEFLSKGSYLKNALAINSARNGIKYAIRAFDIRELYVPYYTCPVVWQAISDEKCKILFYKINKNLLPEEKLPNNAYILYTNYFGVCAKQVKYLCSKYKNLIIDNAQAFFMPHYGIASTYSPRKFFGCPDGGYVITNKELNITLEKDTSFQRCSHLLKRIDCGADFGYEDFNKNDDSLCGENIKLMSNLTSKILNSIDYAEAKIIRLENFHYLSTNLRKYNLFDDTIDKDDVPMYYPFLHETDTLRYNLLNNKIFIPQCWRNMEEKCKEHSYEMYLKKYMHPLIIDQRYNLEDMERIVKVIKETIK